MTATGLGERFTAAFAYAAAHYGADGTGNTHVPAIAHAMAVSALVLDLGGTEDEAIAGLLHDVVEKGGGREALEAIDRQWGSLVARLVEECSDEIEPSGRSWEQRKVGALESMPNKSAAALRISLADKADNVRTLLRSLDHEGGELVTSHSAGDRDTLLWYYGAMVDAFQARCQELGTGCAPLLRELRDSVAQLRTRTAGASEPLGSSA